MSKLFVTETESFTPGLDKSPAQSPGQSLGQSPGQSPGQIPMPPMATRFNTSQRPEDFWKAHDKTKTPAGTTSQSAVNENFSCLTDF